MGHDPSAVAGVNFDRSVARRAAAFARPYRIMIIGFVAVTVGSALLQLVPPILFGRILDDGIANQDKGLVTTLSIIIVMSAIADAALGLTDRWLSSRVGEGLIHDLRVSLFDHVQRMPISFFTNTQTGTLISRLNNDVVGAQRAVTGTLGQVVSNVITVSSTVITMALIEWRLTLLSLVLLPLFIIPAKRIGRVQQRLTREHMNENAAMNSLMTERFGVSGAQLVKLFGRADEEVAEFSGHAGRVRDLGVKSALYGRTFLLALGLVGAIATALVYWIGGILVINGDFAVGTLVTFALLVGRIYRPLTALTGARIDIMTAFVSFERVFEILDTPRVIDDRPGAIDLVDPLGKVTFNNVSFAYPSADSHNIGLKDAPELGSVVLHDLDLTIEAGSMVALVGPSGAGKSTVASLIARLYDVTDGAVEVDGHDVRDLRQDSLRLNIGVVTQDPHLFHDTVGNNLRYAKPGASEDDIIAACTAARIHHVIVALPDGYDTMVGERGYRLSGGEKQRLAIARTLLKDPTVVVLDEATSHLDAE
ncbi:MAG: ABC transporter ATP-binding protein, partial [Actinobacteria bacterium]|nr:ABC transporter ATP-binding protein [Actinomycetota bacterium]